VLQRRELAAAAARVSADRTASTTASQTGRAVVVKSRGICPELSRAAATARAFIPPFSTGRARAPASRPLGSCTLGSFLGGALAADREQHLALAGGGLARLLAFRAAGVGRTALAGEARFSARPPPASARCCSDQRQARRKEEPKVQEPKKAEKPVRAPARSKKAG